jgi:hypothetical protein
MKRHSRVRGTFHAVKTLPLRGSDSFPSFPNRLMPKRPHYPHQRILLDGDHFRCRNQAVMKSCPCRNCSAICPALDISVNLFLCFRITVQTAPQLEKRLCSLAFNKANGELHVPTALSLGENSFGTLQDCWAGRCREKATASVANQTRQ